MKNFFIKSLNGMAFGLFSSLIVGLILKQIGTLFNIEFLIALPWNIPFIKFASSWITPFL